jgi:hypothetical protein
MEEVLVSLEVAETANEKGFRERTRSFYKKGELIIEDKEHIPYDWDWNSSFIGYHSAPTQSLLQKWLREKHKIEVYVLPVFGEKCGYDSFKRFGWCFEIVKNEPCYFLTWADFCQCHEERTDPDHEDIFHKGYETYEETLENGLKHALSMIK